MDEASASQDTPDTQPSILMGDIFMLDWSPGRGSEQGGVSPALIVQNNALNSNPRYPNTIVVAVSKQGRPVPTHVEIPRDPANGLWESVSYAKCEQILTVDKARLQRRIGRITVEQLAAVSRALKRVLSLV